MPTAAFTISQGAWVLFLMLILECRTTEALSSSTSSTQSPFEVVGKGRIASLFLRKEGSLSIDRDSLIGHQSPEGSPIIVATPSLAWVDLYEQCLKPRRTDLIWMGNGLPEKRLGGNNCTWVVPHFGVLEINGPIMASPTSPPTYIYGKHARFLQHILKDEGLVAIQILDTVTDLRVHAVRKLLWASCMWLICHSKCPPINVSQVHSHEAPLLRELAEELWPVVQTLTDDRKADLTAVLRYMEQYNKSMPQAIPSRDLALDELSDRNGVFYRGSGTQPCHERLLWMQLRASDDDENNKEQILEKYLQSR